MSDYVKNALLDASPMRKQKEEAAKLVEKWDKTGLLEGLNKDFEKSGMATLLENQAKQLISEASKTSPSGGDDEEWSGVALPLVRRVFSNIVAQELVSVQPMNLPSGLVFYLDYKYGSSRGNATATDSVFGKTGPNSPESATSPYPDGGFYGAGKAGYTVSGSSTNVVFSNTNGEAVAATDAQLNFDNDVSSSKAGNLWYVTGSLGATDHDATSVRSWKFTGGSGTSNATVLPQFTTVDSAGNMTIVVSASSAANAQGTFAVFYQKSPTATTRGDFEDRQGDATTDYLNIPEIDLQLNSSAIVAKTRKLKAIWTPELAQDLNAYHSVDAEAELTSMLSEYISMEIDLEILDMLIADATTTDYWSAKVGKVYDSGASEFTESSAVSNSYAYTRFDWYQTLVEKIQKVSNTIHQLTLRGGANFCVVGPKVATILESIPGYAAATDGDQAQFAMGVTKIGAISGRFTVYKNPYITENIVLLGFRGANFLETGAVYAPYVPLIMTPLVYDPSDFTPRKGVMTRYAKKMVRPEFYGKIYCSDLNLV